MTVAPARHRFTVDEYHRLAEIGILGEDDRVELIEGELIDMLPIGRRHLAAVDTISELLYASLLGRVQIRTQGTVPLGLRSEPQPDVAVLRRRPDRYANQDATAGDVLLIVEVADSSLAYDRGTKARIYARAGIPDYWVVDLNNSRIFVYRDPSPRGYRLVSQVTRGETVSPLAFPELSLSVDDILCEPQEADDVP
jgi:Uma2 family endonuclease